VVTATMVVSSFSLILGVGLERLFNNYHVAIVFGPARSSSSMALWRKMVQGAKGQLPRQIMFTQFQRWVSRLERAVIQYCRRGFLTHVNAELSLKLRGKDAED
jgi:hypothetical protein